MFTQVAVILLVNWVQLIAMLVVLFAITSRGVKKLFKDDYYIYLSLLLAAVDTLTQLTGITLVQNMAISLAIIITYAFIHEVVKNNTLK